MIIMLALKSEEESKDTIKTTKHLLTERWWETRHLPGLADFLQEEDPER